ncbi:zinc finger MYM-type protein 2-like [Littorina saxatilis]
MSQSAENQSAIIENENNSNIVMESQAAMTGDDSQSMNVEDIVPPLEDAGPETPTQDEVEESMDTDERGGDEGHSQASRGDQELITGAGDASQEATLAEAPFEDVSSGMGAGGDAVSEPQEAPEEPQSPAADVREQVENAVEAMEVEEPEAEQPEAEAAEEAADVLQETVQDAAPEEETAEPFTAESERDEVDQTVFQDQGKEDEPEVLSIPGDDSTEQDNEDVSQPERPLAEECTGVDEDVDNAEIQEAEEEQQDETNQDDTALDENRTAEGETPVSAEEEDKLLAEESSQSKDAAQQDDEAGQEIIADEQEALGDAPEIIEDQHEAGPDQPEVIESEPEVIEDEPEVVEDEPEVIEDEPEVVEDEPEVIEDEPELTKESEEGEQAASQPIEDEDVVENASGEVVEDDDTAAEVDNNATEEGASSDNVQDIPEVAEDSSKPSDDDGKVQEVVSVDESQPVDGSEDQPAVEQSADDPELLLEETTKKAVDAGAEEAAEGGDVSTEAPGKPDNETEGADGVTAEPAGEGVSDSESKPAEESAKPEGEASDDKASDATIEDATARDAEDEPMMQVTDVKSGAEAEGEMAAKQDSGDVAGDDVNKDSEDAPEAMETDEACKDKTDSGDKEVDVVAANVPTPGEGATPVKAAPPDDDDDDVVVLDDDEDSVPPVKKEAAEKELFNSNNDMGIQIESVSGGADELHEQAEQQVIKQENGVEQKPEVSATTPVKKEPQAGGTPTTKKVASKMQTCIVCKRLGKCKYNIVRNGDIKHLCDDACFKRFRTNPTMFLKGTASTGTAAAPAEKKDKGAGKAAVGTPATPVPAKQITPGYKTCVVCQLMNINTHGQFCMWKGLDFCGEGCLGKFQSGIGTSCTLCTAFIPQAVRSVNCLRLGNEVRPFCSNRCYADYKLRMRLCAFCQKDLATATDSFSAPVGSEGSFKDFCSQPCMKKYEDLLNTDVEIIRVEGGKPRGINKCSVCQKNEVTKHAVKYNGVVSNLCSDPCLSAFQYANKLNMNPCDFCNTMCSSLESNPHIVQFEGIQKRFCSDACVTKFRFNHRKSTACSWCGSLRDNFDMIERLDANNKYQLFCSLNCLSLYRVNLQSKVSLQAKSNQAVTCDQCLKFVPAQYHLTMSDASVRNFCSYNCVMVFQSQFSKGTPPPPGPTPPTPRHKHNTRGRGSKATQQAATASPSFPIISNVVSLAPQGGQQKVNIKSNSGVPVVVSGASPSMKSTGTGPVQQQIIIQPPPPKQVKNKSLLCKPFTQTKATSCRPHTQTKECQTDEVKEKPALVPIPVPIYLPAPMAMYTAPAPTPIFIPIPIPVPIFIPTTRKSANGILKQIKEIQEKTPADPLEAEILMMAAAVSADGKHSSDSDTEDEMMPEINKSRKRALPAPADDDDNDADIMPLTSSKEEEGGEEDMISMALRMAEEMSGPITDLESAVEAVPVNTERPTQPTRAITPETIHQEEELNLARNRRGAKRGGGTTARRGAGRPAKRQRMQVPPPEPASMQHDPPAPPVPPADASYHLKFTYGVNAWRHWVLFKNAQIERNAKPGSGRLRLFKTDIMQCTADELNYSLCLFVKEVRKPNGEEYSPDSIYYLTLGIQQYLFENGRIDNIFADLYYERFTECLTELLSKCQPKFNASGQMVCRIEEEHLWECKQLGAHSPYVLLNTLIYFHTKYFMLKTPEDHMKLSFAHILKYWKKGQPGKGGQPTRSVSLRYYSVSTAKKDGSAPTSTTKKGSKEGIPVYEVTENLENPLRCPVKLYEFYLSKCPESIKNRSDIFYPVPERSCVPDSPVWYSTSPISLDVMTKMLTRILLVREIQEAHLHASPIYV